MDTHECENTENVIVNVFTLITGLFSFTSSYFEKTGRTLDQLEDYLQASRPVPEQGSATK